MKSYKPEFADELVRSNEKGPPSAAFNLSQSSLPKTWHVLMTNVLMNNTVNSRNKAWNTVKEIAIIILYMYARMRISHGYDEVGFLRNRLASLDAPEKC